MSELVISHMEHARKLARFHYSKMPSHIDFEEVRSAALLGLCDAASRFDPNKNCSFKSYSAIRITGAIRDLQRKMDWCGRHDRKKLERGEITYISKLEQWPEPPEDGSAWEPTAVDKKVCIEYGIDLEKELSKLDSRKKRIVLAYFYEGITMAAIAKREGVVESRICQLVAEAISEMRNNMQVEITTMQDKPYRAQYSNVECACGCGNLLTNTLVNAGWAYIYGHKGKSNGHSNGLVKVETVNKTKVISAPLAKSFFEQSLQLIREQREEKQRQLLEIQKAIDALLIQEHKLVSVTAAIEALNG